MQFKMILTLIGFLGALATPFALAQAAPDNVLLDMQQAFKKGDAKRLAGLLPQAQGHVLQPWAAYWALRVRLDSASPDEVNAFFSTYQGTYQEDRLRNDWLLLLGQRRDWAGFAAASPDFRMNDDHEVRCYALEKGARPVRWPPKATLPPSNSMRLTSGAKPGWPQRHANSRPVAKPWASWPPMPMRC